MLGAAAEWWDLSALLQIAVLVSLLALSALIAVRRAASRYFPVDAVGAGFAAGEYDEEVHDQSPRNRRRAEAEEAMAGGGGTSGVCEMCRGEATKHCARCKSVWYCSQDCQSKHWNADHKLKCKPLRSLDTADAADKKRSPGFGPVSLVARKKPNKVLFPYDEFLKLFNFTDEGFRPRGLLNCGNSCFANAVLQCLSCTRPLVAYLLGKDHIRECVMRHEEWCFLCELQRHVQRASENPHPFPPINILYHLPNIGSNLGFGRQEDAHEFMRFAIDKMQSACLEEFGGEKALDHNIQETTLVQHIFGGRLQSQVNCTKCGMISNRYDHMMDLTVEIQGDAASLEECLDQFTAKEWLDGENKYKCDGCNDYVKAWKRLTVHEAPNILTITLKRFQGGRFGKLNKRITFPMRLDLTPYMSRTDGSDQYELYAVVVHLDMLNSSFFGHYICFTKDYQGNWYKIDDEKVMTVEEEDVLTQGAYMLLYSRITARREPLVAPKEPSKKQQLSKVLPSNGPNITSPVEESSLPVNLKAYPKSRNDSINEDSVFDKEKSWKIDGTGSALDMDLDTPLEVMTVSMTEELVHADVHNPPSSLIRDGLGEGNSTDNSAISSTQFHSLSRESSSVHYTAVQSEEAAVSCDSCDSMEVEPCSSPLAEALAESRSEVEQQVGMPRPSLDDIVTGTPISLGSTPDTASATYSETATAEKAKQIFYPGFLDKTTKNKSSVNVKRTQVGNDRVAHLAKQSGLCNGHLPNGVSGQEYMDSAIESSSSSSNSNGGVASTSNYSIPSSMNTDNKSSRPSLHGDGQGSGSFVPRGFLNQSYREPSLKGTSTNSVHDHKTNNGFLALSNNGYSSFVNGHNQSISDSSAGDADGGLSFISRGSLTKLYGESARKNTSRSNLQNKSISERSLEQISSAESVDGLERSRSGCTISGGANGLKLDCDSAFNENGNSYHEKEVHAAVATEKSMCPGKFNDDAAFSENGGNYHLEDSQLRRRRNVASEFAGDVD